MTGTWSTSHRERIQAFYNQLAPRRSKFVKRRHAYYDDLLHWLTFRIPRSASIAEVGCGIGAIIAHMPNQKKLGIDASPTMIKLACERDSTTQYLSGFIETAPVDSPMDYVIMIDTVNVLSDVHCAFTAIRQKLCHQHTTLILTYHNFLWKPLISLAAKLGMKTPSLSPNWLSPHDVHTLLRLAGFDVVTDGHRLLWPWATPIIAFFCNRILCALPFFRHLALVHYTVARVRPGSNDRKETSVSIVIPARNEEGNISEAVRRLPAFGTSLEIIFVEGHSTDRTWEAIQTLISTYTGPHTLRALQQKGKGKGDAVRAGFAEATGDIFMILDADLTVDPSELPVFYHSLVDGMGDFVYGSRLVYPMEDEAMRFLNILGNKGFSLIFSWLLGQTIKDTLCGTKVLRRRDYEHIIAERDAFGDTDPFGDFDLLFGASRYYLRMIEVPIHYRARMYGATNIDRFRDGWKLLMMCGVAARVLTFR